MAELAGGGPTRVADVVGGLADGRLDVSTRAAEDRRETVARHGGARRLAGALVAAGALLLLARAQLPDALRLAALLVTLPWALVVARRA